MGRIIKYLAGIVLISALVVSGYFWVQGREPADNGYTLVEVTRGEIIEKAVAVGQIEPRLEFHVKSKISGIVRRCFVEVGDAVDAGDPLFEEAVQITSGQEVRESGGGRWRGLDLSREPVHPQRGAGAEAAQTATQEDQDGDDDRHDDGNGALALVVG